MDANFEIKSLQTCIFTSKYLVVGDVESGRVGGTGDCVTDCKQDFMLWPFSLLVCAAISFPPNTPFLKSHELCYVFCLVISRYFLCEFSFYPLAIWYCAVWISLCLWASNFFPDFWLYPIAIEGLNFLSVFASAYNPSWGGWSRKMCCLSLGEVSCGWLAGLAGLAPS